MEVSGFVIQDLASHVYQDMVRVPGMMLGCFLSTTISLFSASEHRQQRSTHEAPLTL